MAEEEKAAAAAAEEEYESDVDDAPLPALRRRTEATDEDEDEDDGGGVAAAAEEEYESEVDDAPLPALRRRAKASDEDEDDGGGGRGSPPPSTVVGSDSDSDRQGAAEVYDEDEGSEKCDGVQEDFGAGRGGGHAKEVANEGKYEEEFESDVDDAPLPALRRRAEASDEDDGGGGRGSPPPSTVVGSDSDSDGQGAAEVYDEDEGSEKCDGVQEDFGAGRGGGGGHAEEVTNGGKYEEEEAQAKGGTTVEGGDKEKKGVKPYTMPRMGAFFMHDDRFHNKENCSHGLQREFFGGQKLWHPKDDSVWVHDRFDEMNIHDVQHGNVCITPYAVPRIDAFFMHDDRFHNKENGSHGLQREFFGGQKLCHPKDDSVWVHDRFDEMDIHDVHHANTRRPTIPFRAWAGDRTNGVNHGYLEGTKSPSYYHGNRADYKYIPKNSLTRYESSNNHNKFPNDAHTSYDNSKNYRSFPRKFHSYYDDKNFDNARREPRIYHVNAKGYSDAPNVCGGKQSRPYQPHWKTTFGISSVQTNRTHSRSQNEEACSGAGEGKRSYRTSNLQNEQDSPLEQELSLIQRRKARPAIFSKLFATSVHMAHSSLKTQSRPVLGVKAFVPSGGNGNPVDSLSTVSIKGMPSLGSHSSVSTSNNYRQYSESRDQGSGLNNGEPAKNNFCSTGQTTRSYTEFNDGVYQQRSVQQVQPRQRAYTQIFHQNIGSTNNIQSHPQATSTSSIEDAEASPPPGSMNYEALSVVIGQNDKEEPMSASFPHDGGHALGVTGARDLNLGDQGFPGTPAVLPAMLFSGQYPSRPDIPSIGMAVPGLWSQQVGGNSETNRMTWPPTLSGATGAFGETYHPCYFGSYYPQPSELPSSTSRNHSVTDAPVSLNSHEIPDVVNHELCQRKNKPRRYSEMSFASLT